MIINVDQQNFQTQVIQQSQRVPVLVDFWAPWCGPCRMLTPVLERVARAENGRFILAKLNTDENPQLSMQYGVRGIPNVKLFKNGHVADEFVGAQPEPMVRQFLRRHLSGAAPGAAPGAQKRPSAPPDDAGRLRQARRHLQQGDGCAAEPLLRAVGSAPHAAAARRLLPLATFLCAAGRGQVPGDTPAVQNVYRQAAAALRREPSAALYHLLTALHQEPAAHKARARAVMQGVFELLGDEEFLVKQYQPLI